MKKSCKIFITTFFVVLACWIFNGGALALTFTDVEGTAYEEAVGVLSQLKILNGYDDGTFRPENGITRAEFAAVVTRVLGVGEDQIANLATRETEFVDVPQSHWASGYINAASGSKIINGYGDGNFGPEDQVTYEQAVKMIVCALGYETVAFERGGYPDGYLNIAYERGITRGADSAHNLPAMRGIVARLTFNSLDIDLMRTNAAGKTSIISGQNLLTENLRLFRADGRICGTEFTTFESGAGVIKSDEVAIREGNTINLYRVGETAAKDYLGYTVSAYYRNDGSFKTLTIILPDASTTTTTIEIDDIVELDQSGTSFTHYPTLDSNRTVTVRASSDRKIIFNGRYTTKGIYELLEFKDGAPTRTGQIKFLGTGDVNDVLFITAYDTWVVQSTKAADFLVYDKESSIHSAALNLNTSVNESVVIKNKSGADVAFTSLKEWDVLSVLSSGDALPIVNVTVVTDKVEGRVREISSQTLTTSTTVTINATEYRLSPRFIQSVTSKNITLDIDDEGTFYLDAQGKIAAVNKKVGSGNSAFAYLARVAAESTMNAQPQVKIVTSNNTVRTLYCSSKININGTVCSSYSDALKELDKISREVITYKLDSKGEVSSIETAASEKSFRKYYDSNKVELKYSLSGKSFDNNVTGDSSTIVFVEPLDPNSADDPQARTMSYFKDETSYAIRAYTSKTNETVAEILVVTVDFTGSESEIPVTEPIILVETITNTTNSDGYSVQRVTGPRYGSAASLLTRDTGVLSGVSTGDIIRVAEDPKGNVSRYEKIFDGKTNTPYTDLISSKKNTDKNVLEFETTTNKNHEYSVVYGIVYSRTGSDVRIAPVTQAITDSTTIDPSKLVSYKLPDTLYGYDPAKSDGNKFNPEEIPEAAIAYIDLPYTNSAEKIRAASKILIYLRNNTPRTVVIFNK